MFFCGCRERSILRMQNAIIIRERVYYSSSRSCSVLFLRALWRKFGAFSYSPQKIGLRSKNDILRGYFSLSLPALSHLLPKQDLYRLAWKTKNTWSTRNRYCPNVTRLNIYSREGLSANTEAFQVYVKILLELSLIAHLFCIFLSPWILGVTTIQVFRQIAQETRRSAFA